MDFLYLDPVFQMLICKRCQYAIVLGTVRCTPHIYSYSFNAYKSARATLRPLRLITSYVSVRSYSTCNVWSFDEAVVRMCCIDMMIVITFCYFLQVEHMDMRVN
jgi:hypothetical protein